MVVLHNILLPISRMLCSIPRVLHQSCCPAMTCLVHLNGRLQSTLPNMEFVKAEKVGTDGRVGLVTLNRPKALNALNDSLLDDLMTSLRYFDSDPEVGAMVLTGSDKSFAAGADIKTMQDKDFAQMYQGQVLKSLDMIPSIKKPIVAAVNGRYHI